MHYFMVAGKTELTGTILFIVLSHFNTVKL